MENTIILTNSDIIIDIMTAVVYGALLINVGYAIYKLAMRDEKITPPEVIIICFYSLIAVLYLYQVWLQLDRGGRSAIPRVWDFVNLLSAIVAHMSIIVITRYRGVSVQDEKPIVRKTGIL